MWTRVESAPVCFFLISVAYKTAWTAISSLLSQFSRDFGPQVLLHLNVAYFFPSIPVLLLQSAFQERIEQRFGLAGSALARFSIGLGALVLLTASFPAFCHSESWLLAATVLVGMSYGLAFGTSYQLVSKFPKHNTVALTLGFVSCGPVVLLFDLMCKSGTYYSPSGMVALFRLVALQTSLGLAAAFWLVLRHRKQLAGVRYLGAAVEPLKSSSTGKANGSHSQGWASDKPSGWRASSAALLSPRPGSSGPPSSDMEFLDTELGDTSGHKQHQHLASARHSSALVGARGSAKSLWVVAQHDSAWGGADVNDKATRHVPLLRLALQISPAALAIFLSVGSSMLVFPFFTYVRSTGLLGEKLPEVLFYVRLVGDILGRVAPRQLQVRTPCWLLLWALLKTAMILPLLASISYPESWLGDVGALLLVASFWVLSGYLNTAAYLVAPSLVAPSQAGRAGGLMACAFQTSCFLGLMAAYVLQSMLA